MLTCVVYRGGRSGRDEEGELEKCTNSRLRK